MEDEYQTEPVPQDASIPWLRIAFLNAVFSISLPTFLSGVELSAAAPAWTFVTGVLAGGAVLTIMAAFMGVIGTETRLSSYMLARFAFGKQASTLLNLAFAVSLLGWFGLNIELFADAMAQLAIQYGVTVPLIALEVLGGVMMTALTYLGLRRINYLSLIVTPVLAVVTVLMLLLVLDVGSFSQLIAKGPEAGLSFGDVLSATVGGVAVGAVIMPDTCRFIEGRSGGVGVAITTYLISAPAVTLVAGLASLASGQSDILPLMLALGLGFGAFAIVFGGSTTLNALNLYSATLSVGTVWPQIPRSAMVLMGGIGGTVFAFFDILESFIPFLIYLTVIFIPVGAVIVADYFLVPHSSYAFTEFDDVEPVRWPALCAWGLGSAVAFAGMNGLITLTGTVAFDAILVSFTAHLALSRIGQAKAAAA